MLSFKNKGFTLIELLIVIVVIALLSTMVMVNIGQTTSKGRDARRTSDLKQMATGLELYFQTNTSYPLASNTNCWSTDDACWGAPAGTLYTLLKPYMPLAPKDPKQPTSGPCMTAQSGPDCYIYYYCHTTDDQFVIAANLENPLKQTMPPNTSCPTGGPYHFWVGN